MDAQTLLGSNERTRKYYDEYRSFSDEYKSKLSFDDVIMYEEMMVNYEQGIGISAFLLGFSMCMRMSKGIEEDRFVSSFLDLMKV